MAATSTGGTKTFSFSSRSLFDGKKFFEKYKGADFLREQENIKHVLVRGYELQQSLDALEPGESLVVEGMFIKPDVPLVIKKSGRIDDSDVDNDEFTFRRFSGLVVAYLFHDIRHFSEQSSIYASEPEALGLAWSNARYPDDQRKLYLSAVSGAEYFVDEFDYVPLICALRKYQLKQLSDDMLVKIAMVPYTATDEPIALRLRINLAFASKYSKLFGDDFNIEEVIKTAPAELQCYFKYLQPKSK